MIRIITSLMNGITRNNNMHIANMKTWIYCRDKYTPYFNNVESIVEFGSHNVNGTVRNLFSNYKEYVGVDWRAGPNVDFVSLAHKVPWFNHFDTVVSSSLLEHDPHWKKSLIKMTEVMKLNSILLLSWGGALNPPHNHDHAPDCGFHPLPAKMVMDKLQELGIYIHEFRYEGNMEGVHLSECVSKDGLGEVFLVGFKDKEFALGEKCIETLTPADALQKGSSSIAKKPTKYPKSTPEEVEALQALFPRP